MPPGGIGLPTGHAVGRLPLPWQGRKWSLNGIANLTASVCFSLRRGARDSARSQAPLESSEAIALDSHTADRELRLRFRQFSERNGRVTAAGERIQYCEQERKRLFGKVHRLRQVDEMAQEISVLEAPKRWRGV
jgi:hypothetical protein